MRRIRSPVGMLLSALLLAASGACASSSIGDRQPSSGGVTILTSEQLRGGVSILDALTGRVAALQITRSRDGGCPHVALRGQRSFGTQSSAVVYVDGTLMGNTCVLEQIPPRDVERVEVYSAGSSNLPAGYRSSPFGLIAVYRHVSVRN